MELHSQARGDRLVRPLHGAHIPDRGVVDRITRLLLRDVEGVSLTQERGVKALAHWIVVTAYAIHHGYDRGPRGGRFVVRDSWRGVEIRRVGAAFQSGDQL